MRPCHEVSKPLDCAIAGLSYALSYFSVTLCVRSLLFSAHHEGKIFCNLYLLLLLLATSHEPLGHPQEVTGSKLSRDRKSWSLRNRSPGSAMMERYMKLIQKAKRQRI